MNLQLQNIIIMVSAILASTQIPFKDPDVLNAARTTYLSINLAVLAFLVYVRLRIAQVQDSTPLPPTSNQDDKTPKPSTVETHDLHHFNTLLKSHLTSMLIVALMHLYFRLPTPLLIQSILPMKNALESQVVRVYVLGRPAIGRPWEEGKGVADAVRGLFGKGDKVKGVTNMNGEGAKKSQ